MNHSSVTASRPDTADSWEAWLDELPPPCGGVSETVLLGAERPQTPTFVVPVAEPGERQPEVTTRVGEAVTDRPLTIGGVCATTAELSGFDDDDEDYGDSDTPAGEDGEEDEFDDFDDIDDEDFDDDFDDDFEEELEDDYEIEIEDEISAEFGLSGTSGDDDDVELEDLDDVVDADVDDVEDLEEDL